MPSSRLSERAAQGWKSDISISYQDTNTIRNYDKSMKHEFSTLNPGDYVFNINHLDPHHKKLTFKWTAPYRVIANEGRDDFYKVINLVQDETQTLHRSELKITYGSSGEDLILITSLLILSRISRFKN